MKKNYISLCLIAVAIGVKSQDVLTYVGSGATVTVKSNTLFYNGGGLEVAAGSSSSNVSKIDNSGNIMIVGVPADGLKVAGTNAQFNLKSTSATEYGQLYIQDIPQNNIATSIVNKEYIAEYIHGGADSGRQQVGLPFSGLNATLINAIFENKLNLNTNNRFSESSAFLWSNSSARFDQIGYSNAKTTPTAYYIFPKKSGTTGIWINPKSLKTFSGIPVSDADVKVSLNDAFTGSFGNNGSDSNYYREKYRTYINDPFEDKTLGWGAINQSYGRNLYQYSNPFFTNLDLKYIATASDVGVASDGHNISNLQGIAYYKEGALSWNINSGTTVDGDNVSVTTVQGGVLQGGDPLTIIRPMTAFMIKLNGTSADKLDFSKLRTFRSLNRDVNDPMRVASRESNKYNLSDDKVVKQVAVIMQDNDGIEIGRTYYAVSNSSVSGHNPSLTKLQSYAENRIVYTKEEKAQDGGEDTSLGYQLYINEANESDFKTKEIPLFIKYNDEPYNLKFEVYELGERVSALSNGNSFYIKDVDGSIVKIDDNTSLSLYGSQKLGLYYEKPSGTLSTDNNLKSLTTIAKKSSQWAVRFAKDWKNATVEVYSVSGQLLSKNLNVSTNADYIIPFNFTQNSVYLVKAISSNGEVVVKKIIN